MEIIPALDIRRGNCVRLRQGKPEEEIIYSRNPLAMARRWEREGAARLHVVDLDGAFLGKLVNKKLIVEIARNLSIPIQVGGGIRTLAHIEYYLSQGVEKVILGTKVLRDRNFLGKANEKFPGRILVALDVKNGQVAIEGWKKVSSVSALSWVEEIKKTGAAGLIYTDTSRDGMLGGPNIKFTEALLKEITEPLIISGGISELSDIRMIRKISRGRVSGLIIGQALYTARFKLREAIACAKD